SKRATGGPAFPPPRPSPPAIGQLGPRGSPGPPSAPATSLNPSRLLWENLARLPLGLLTRLQHAASLLGNLPLLIFTNNYNHIVSDLSREHRLPILQAVNNNGPVALNLFVNNFHRSPVVEKALFFDQLQRVLGRGLRSEFCDRFHFLLPCGINPFRDRVA